MGARFTYIAVIFLLLCCCGETERHAELFDRIDALCDSEPEKARSMLDSIDMTGASEGERHHYDLLRIKASDKAYVTHTSDSLILDVLDFYSGHKDSPLYAQALYYGGRVYSDLGDYPTAIKYFQKALDNIPDDEENMRLRSTVLSQTGGLLNDIRLHSEAIPYVLESIDISKRLNDSVNVAFDNMMLISPALDMGKVSDAKKYLEDAAKYSNALSPNDKTLLHIEQALILHHENKIDSALQVIRALPSVCDSLSYNYYLAVASEIYRDSGITDSAYIYARRLTESHDVRNKKTGFKVIFSSKLANVIPKDTLVSLIQQYKSTIEDYLNTHEAEEALIQNSNYNYILHVKEREKAERSRYRLFFIMLVVIAVSAVLLAVLLYFRSRNAVLMLKFHKALDLIAKMKAEHALEIAEMERGKTEPESDGEENADVKDAVTDDAAISEIILRSDIYALLMDKIRKQRGISDNEDVFERLEAVIESASPGFTIRLKTLAGGKLSDIDLRIAMLTRCGISPSNIAILMNRMKNTISSHRSALAKKIIGAHARTKMLDDVILRL